MNGKKSFIIYNDQSELFNALSDEQAGKLIKEIFNYENGIETNLDNFLKIAFIPIKQNLDRNREKYQTIRQKRIEAGAMGGKQKVANASKCKQNVANVAVNDNVNVNVSVSDTVTVNENDNVTVNDIPKGIIDYLNIKANKNYKYTKSNISLINSRLKENYQTEDFKTVIDKKCSEWKNTDYEKYLQPSTLFGNKFDNYLNQNIKVNINQIAFTDEEMESLGLERLDFNE